MKKPKLYVIAGPNGSGKTTFAEKFLPHYAGCFEFVNADLIAKGLSPFNPSKIAIKAGKILLEQIADCSRRRIDFAFETTLSGKSYANTFKNIKRDGYEVHMLFLWIPDVRLSLARVADRVRKGGHGIPDEDVKRRFSRGLSNLFHIYLDFFDTCSIFDNSTDAPELIAKVEKNLRSVLVPAKYKQILKQARWKSEI